jgi:hypothetical protein
MEPEGSLSHSQEPATCPYPEPYQSSPLPPIPLLEDPWGVVRLRMEERPPDMDKISSRGKQIGVVFQLGD